LNAARLLPLLTALVLLGAKVPNASAQDQPANDAARLRIVKFHYDGPQPARLDVTVFKYPETPKTPAARNYIKRLVGLPGETVVIRDGVLSRTPGPVIERITIEGGKVEISGDLIKIEGGKVEIIRQPRP
jgi:signal peptidase I